MDFFYLKIGEMILIKEQLSQTKQQMKIVRQDEICVYCGTTVIPNSMLQQDMDSDMENSWH